MICAFAILFMHCRSLYFLAYDSSSRLLCRLLLLALLTLHKSVQEWMFGELWTLVELCVRRVVSGESGHSGRANAWKMGTFNYSRFYIRSINPVLSLYSTMNGLSLLYYSESCSVCGWLDAGVEGRQRWVGRSGLSMGCHTRAVHESHVEKVGAMSSLLLMTLIELIENCMLYISVITCVSEWAESPNLQLFSFTTTPISKTRYLRQVFVVHTDTHMHVHVHMNAHTHTHHTTHTYAHTHTDLHTETLMHTHKHMHSHWSTHSHIHEHIHSHAHIHVYAHMHTYTNACTIARAAHMLACCFLKTCSV